MYFTLRHTFIRVTLCANDLNKKKRQIRIKIARSGHRSMSRLGHIARSGYSPIGFGPDLIIIMIQVMMTMTHLSGTPHLKILDGLTRTPSIAGNHSLNDQALFVCSTHQLVCSISFKYFILMKFLLI